MSVLLLYVLLSTAFFYLGSRALITSWLWSRYPRWLAGFMDCSACTGFWYGFLIALIYGRNEKVVPLGLHVSDWFMPPLVGLCTLVLTPIAAGIMQRCLDMLGSAVPPPED